MRLRGQGQGLDLRGQELQNVSSRTSSRPRTSSRTPPPHKIIRKRASNNLACALQFFYFFAFFLLKKFFAFFFAQNFFCVFFWDSRAKSQILTPHPCPSSPFEDFSLYTLNSEQKPSVKKPVDRAGQKPVDRPVDRPVNRRWFWNLPVGSGRENPDRFHLWFKQPQLEN